MKTLIPFVIFFLIHVTASSQQLSNIRSGFIRIKGDTVQLDSLSLIPNSVFISDDKGRLVPDSLYFLDHARGILIIKPGYRNYFPDSVKTSYRVFPISFMKPYSHKDISRLNTAPGDATNTFKLTYGQEKKGSFFDKDELNKRGSISRGITFGNNQDVIVNSNLNLQLAGKISDNFEILAAITDNNIPIQPDGNSQQIQEFDKVFVQLYNKSVKIIVGDYELGKPAGLYMNMYKKVQGGYFSTNTGIGKEKKIRLKTTCSGAIAKGKYNKMNFNGIEGNQGPYKLTGAENETFIIVLAGTEKVYIDGKLLKRGQDNDYTIDYNTGEIIFTPNQFITKDKRIMAEYQYSDKNYARFLVFNSNEFQSAKSRFWINMFDEQDSKNQPIDQTLTDVHKKILALAGDSLMDAVVPKIDSVPFRNDIVLYKRVDTVVSGISYHDIYVYSVNPDSARFRLGFSFVGYNRGNYIQVMSSANGKVYKWVAPVAGIRQGSHEPVVLLSTPKKKQMLSAGGEIMVTGSTKANFEFSVTNNNKNTFSSKDKADDSGYAFLTGIRQDFLNADTARTKLFTVVTYQFITKEFNPVERFRGVEYSRDWNLAGSAGQQLEHQVSGNINYFKKSLGTVQAGTDFLQHENGFSGIRNGVSSDLKYLNFHLSAKGNLLNTKDTINETRFLRHSASFSRYFSLFVLGVKEEAEENLWNPVHADSLAKNSFSYNQYEAFASNRDTSKIGITCNYKLREDFLPVKDKLRYAMKAQDFSLGAAFNGNPDNQLKTTVTFRELSIGDTMLTKNKAENTVNGRIEHNLKAVKGVFSTSTFYELGSGLEIKKEFSYIEVAPGQGVYQWSDYNNNGIKELNEFDIANFSDQANYIRVFTPTNQFVKAYTNQFNHTLNIKPERAWANKGGVRKFISRFSDQMAYRTDIKETRTDIMKTANPFDLPQENDTTLISTAESFRNTFSLNRSHPVWGIDLIYQEHRNKILLTNGFDTRSGSFNGLRLRWNISRFLTLLNNNDIGDKKYKSEFFSSKNYRIKYITDETTLNIQPGQYSRISLIYKFNDKQNMMGKDKSQMHNAGVEFRYNAVTKGNLTVTVNYINITYSTGADSVNTNTPVAFEMLESLLPGNNGTWSLQFQKNLTDVLQMNLIYNGRISEGSKMIHVGSVQLRASF